MSRAVLAGVFLFTLVVAGCAALGNLVSLGSDIQDAGYKSVSCDANTVNGHTVLAVTASTTDGAEATDEDATRVAEVVWKKYDGSFDELRVTVNGAPMMSATNAELAEQFGDRPAGVGTGTEGGGGNTVLVVVLTVVGALVVAGLAVLVWWRGRKPPPPVAPPPYQYPPAA